MIDYCNRVPLCCCLLYKTQRSNLQLNKLIFAVAGQAFIQIIGKLEPSMQRLSNIFVLLSLLHLYSWDQLIGLL